MFPLLLPLPSDRVLSKGRILASPPDAVASVEQANVDRNLANKSTDYRVARERGRRRARKPLSSLPASVVVVVYEVITFRGRWDISTKGSALRDAR